MLDLIPLYAAAFALLLDIFNLSRPWIARNPQVPDWPWQIIGATVLTATIIVVGISIQPFVHERSWGMVTVGFALIAASFGLVIFTFMGWRRARQAGERAASRLLAVAPFERRIHLSSMLIAFFGVMAELIHRW